MTQQYLVGELSLLLGQLHTAMRGDAAAFVRQASIGAELWEFAVGAGLLEERWVQHTYTGRGSAVALDGRGGLEPPTGGP